MKARLFATAILLGVCAGCAHEHEGAHEHATQVDEQVLSEEIFAKLTYDLEHPPYYLSSLRWGQVYKGMVSIGVLPEEADHQVRKAARSLVSARDVDKLLDKHETDAEAFLDALDEAHLASVGGKKKTDEDEFAYALPSQEAADRWARLARLIDRPPFCGNALHWLPVYKDLMRLGFTEQEGYAYVRRSVLAGMSRFTVEELIDTSKKDNEVFAANYEVSVEKSATVRANTRSQGLKAFFKGKEFTPKKTPLAEDITPLEANESAAPEGGEAPPAEGDEDMEGPPAEGDEDMEGPPADGMEDEDMDAPPADGDEDMDAPPAEGDDMDAPPADGDEGMEDPPADGDEGMEEPPAEDDAPPPDVYEGE